MFMNEVVEKINDRHKTEIIDGKIYLMASASGEHINIQDNLNNIFNNYFRQNKRRCRAMNEHEIYINKSNRLKPDVKVLCREKDPNTDIPVIVIEVLSKTTQDRDLGIKMKKYAELGIKEYWIISWELSSIAVYLLSEEKEEKRYEHYKSYALVLPEDEIEDKAAGQEFADEFSPLSFPELHIKLADVFDIFI
jgi:Uma2 family endonuclease